MNRCQQCSSEVRGLTETATRLAYNASRPPPVLMRDRVLTAVSQTRQLPPVVDKRAEDRPKRSSPWWRLWTGAPYVLAMASVIALIVDARRPGEYRPPARPGQGQDRGADRRAFRARLPCQDADGVQRNPGHGGVLTAQARAGVHFARAAAAAVGQGVPALADRQVAHPLGGPAQRGIGENSRPVLAEGLCRAM